VQPVTNGQPAAAPTNNNIAPSQPDPLAGGFGMGDTAGVSPSFKTITISTDFLKFEYQPMDFANPGNGNMDVLQDFDFDSFLHQDGDGGVDSFNFEFSGLDGNEIGAE
jgi:hypothetical protein